MVFDLRLRVFETRVLGRICGQRRDEATGGWGKLHNEEFRNLYSSPSIIWSDKVKEGEIGRAYSTNREGKRPVGKPRNGWVEY
jgi:hypothetical protein